MTTISDADMQKLARMSSLTFSDEQQESIRKELDEILGFVALLNEVDTTDLVPTYQVNNPQTVTREDVIIDYVVDRKDLLDAAQNEHGQIVVPRVIE